MVEPLYQVLIVAVALFSLFLVASVCVIYWMLSHYRRVKETTDQQQSRAQEQLEQADELQRRSLELMNRAEAFFTRVESLVTRLENKAGT